MVNNNAYIPQASMFNPETAMSDNSAPIAILPNGAVGGERSSTTHNNPNGPFGHIYSKSIKLSSTGGGNSGSAAKTFSASKMQYPTSIFGSPEKPSRALKSKIPTMTLQSREDLYEQNMLTKMQINNLRNENRKINTKLVVLENQLAQKDKLFEDMYKAAFT